jgi:hypothetical protein
MKAATAPIRTLPAIPGLTIQTLFMVSSRGTTNPLSLIKALITPPTAPPKRTIPNGIHIGIVSPFFGTDPSDPELNSSAGTRNKSDSNYSHYNFFYFEIVLILF